MNGNKLFKYLILSVFLISSIHQNVYGQDNIEKVESIIKHIPEQDINFEIDYADQVEINYWEKDSIKIVALVDLRDVNGKSKNKNFDMKNNRLGGRHNITAKVKSLEAHYVLQKSGSDYKPTGAYSDKVLRVGTQLEITLPKNINLDFKSSMGDIKINHNGGGLLVSTHGSIYLRLDMEVKADLKLNTLFGELLVDEKLKIEQDHPKQGLRKLNSREALDYQINGGSGTQISLAAHGDITIVSKKD